LSQGRVHLNPDGKETRTEWEVLGSSVRLYWSYSVVLAQLNLVQPTVPLTLLRLKLLTGHKHQLRVHLAKCLNGKGSWIQRTMSFKVRVAPIVGDELYANDLPTEEIKAAETIVAARNKTFLHASEISLRVWMILTSHFPSMTSFSSDGPNLAAQRNILILHFVCPFRYPFELSVRKHIYLSICNIWSKGKFSWMANHGMRQTIYTMNRKNAGFHLSSSHEKSGLYNEIR